MFLRGGVHVVCRTCGREWVLADRDLEAYCSSCGESLREEVEAATEGLGGWYWTLQRTARIGTAAMFLAMGIAILAATVLRPAVGDDSAYALAWLIAALGTAAFLYRVVRGSKRRRRPAPPARERRRPRRR